MTNVQQDDKHGIVNTFSRCKLVPITEITGISQYPFMLPP